jgi:hypothetical protein
MREGMPIMALHTEFVLYGAPGTGKHTQIVHYNKYLIRIEQVFFCVKEALNAYEILLIACIHSDEQ